MKEIIMKHLDFIMLIIGLIMMLYVGSLVLHQQIINMESCNCTKTLW